MLKHILIPLDGSSRAEQALALAGRICRQTQARLSFISVIDPHMISAKAGEDADSSSKLQEKEQKLRRYQAQTVERYRIADLEPALFVQQGEIVPTILDVAQQSQCDLIILVSHGKTEARPEHMGRIAQQLVQQCPIPLLVLKGGAYIPESAYPDKRRPLHNLEIVVALDGSQEAEQAISPAVDLVSAIAAPQKGAVHLLRVVPPHPQQSDNNENLQEVASYNQMYHEAVDYIGEQARKLQRREEDGLNIMTTCSIYAAQDVPSALKYFVEERQGSIAGGSDLLAMYTKNRPTRRHESARVTEEVLSLTSYPLLII